MTTQEAIEKLSSIGATKPVPPEAEKIRDPKTIEFPDSADLVAFFDPLINEGKVVLHPWQLEVSELLCNAKATDQNPFKYCLCAANGSGKDAFVIAPFAVWFALTKTKSRTIITSSSGIQLTNQTEKYIRELCFKVNAWFNSVFGQADIFNVTQRRIDCKLTGSIIQMFATDEEAKAEGYHPLEPGAAFAIIVNEAKSVAPDIFRALRRCTGYNYWIDVSTPGEPFGDFYKHFTSWKHTRRVTFFDCPHQSRSEFEEDRIDLGEFSPLFRSKWLALFTTVGGNVVISQQAMERYKRFLAQGILREKFTKTWPMRIGIDLAAGGDESVVSVFKGNKQLALHTSREADTTKTADWIERIIIDYHLPRDHDYIFADDGGVGRAIIDMLQRKGWAVKRVLNNSVAHRKKDFRNRGAELWFKMARMIEESAIILLEDFKLFEQLGTRRYKKSDINDKPGLEKKAEAKADGLASPDRADATVLAFTDVPLEDILSDEVEIKTGPQTKAVYSAQEYAELLYNNEMPTGVGTEEPVYSSLNAIIKQSRGRTSHFEYVKS